MEKKNSGECNCESCGMSIDNGMYCQYCVTENGELQAFEERFERMVQWINHEEEGLSQNEAETKTRAYMRKMPAWKDHPSLEIPSKE